MLENFIKRESSTKDDHNTSSNFGGLHIRNKIGFGTKTGAGLWRACMLLILGLSLTACGGGGGGGGSSSSATTISGFGITDFSFTIYENNLTLSWTNPVNPPNNIANYTITAVAYNADVGGDNITGRVSQTFEYTTNNKTQDIVYTPLMPGSGKFYEFFIIANYGDEGNINELPFYISSLADLDLNYNSLFAPNVATSVSSGELLLFGGRLFAGTNTDGDGLADRQDLDDDNDGVPDMNSTHPIADNCQFIANPDQNNTDGVLADGGDACDTTVDFDNDGVIDVADLFPEDATQAGDIDGDGIDGLNDNCPSVANDPSNTNNPDDQPDADLDEYGDACDVDADGNGLIEISSAAELDMLRNNLAGTGLSDTPGTVGNSDGCGNGTDSATDITECSGYELVADIDLAGFDNWIPIGSCSNNACSTNDPFTGVFDGQGYSIANLSINNPQDRHGSGLFGAAARTEIRNLQLSNLNISLTSNSNLVGGLAGYMIDSNISNINIVANSISGRSNVGGVVGILNNGNVYNVSVVANSIRSRDQIGGLIGRFDVGTMTYSSAFIGEINALTGSIGGLVGIMANRDSVNIFSSVAVVHSITANNANIGGLLGRNNNANLEIVGSLALAHSIFSSSSEVGGLVGQLGNDNEVMYSSAIVHSITASLGLGGMFGDASSTGPLILEYSLAITQIINATGDGRFIGGLIGSGSATVADSYFRNDPDPFVQPATSPHGSGQSDSALKTPTGFSGIYANWGGANTGWCDPATGVHSDAMVAPDGYEPVWDIGENDEYPAINCLHLTLEQQRLLHPIILNGESPFGSSSPLPDSKKPLVPTSP